MEQGFEQQTRLGRIQVWIWLLSVCLAQLNKCTVLCNKFTFISFCLVNNSVYAFCQQNIFKTIYLNCNVTISKFLI
jgi:hypothetical protein